ncbi:MAG: MFS transporter, partial [Dysgonomonas sp.]
NKSMVNSMQSLGSFGGAMIGGGVLLLLYHSLGWNQLLPYLAVFVAIALIPLVFFKEKDVDQPIESKNNSAVSFDDWLGFFKQKGIWKQVIFLFIYFAGLIGILSMLKPMLVDYGYNMKQIGVMSGVIGSSIGCLGSLLGGFIVRKIGCFIPRIIFAVMILLSAIYFYLLVTRLDVNIATLHFGISLLWLSYGLGTIVVYTTSMECVRKGFEGTDFTLQTVITHISGMIMAVGAGKLADVLGYDSLFLVEIAIAAVSLLYILSAFRNLKNDGKSTDR